MNRLSTYFLHITSALALGASVYVLWNQERQSNVQRPTASRSKTADTAETPTYDAITGRGQAEDTFADERQREEIIQAEEDTLLLQQYNWNVYTKSPTPVATVYEATLLIDFLSNLGVTVDQAEAKRLLATNDGLRSDLLEGWRTGCFDLLRGNGNVLILVDKPSGKSNLGRYEKIRKAKTDNGDGVGFEGLMSHAREIEIYGGNFKNIAGDSFDVTYLSDHHRKVAKWYSSTDYRLTHHDISKKRAENTGAWLLNTQMFKMWMTDPSCRVLWCPGIPGVGKTTIASLVIDYLRLRRSEMVAVGFAYFNYKLRSRQNTTMVLECLARQLYEVYHDSEASSSLGEFYHNKKGDHSQAPAIGLHAVLSKTFHHFHQCYIVLDALDEYLENYNIKDLRELLYTLTSLGNGIKLLITSRILDGMECLFRELDAFREDIIASNEDMVTYIRSRMNAARFLMVELHMNTLAETLHRGGLKDALAKLPYDIDATYERVLQRFRTYPEAHRELAMLTLTLVARAKRRLSVRELQHALATHPGLDNIEDYVTSISTITSLCAGLVIVQDETVMFVHFTAQDFFDNPRIQSEYFPGAERSILKICLTYISLSQFTSLNTKAGSAEQHYFMPFSDYAVKNLGRHAQEVEQGDEVLKELDLFLASNHTALRLCCTQMLANDTPQLLRIAETSSSAVLLAMCYGRIAVLPTLLDSFKEDCYPDFHIY